eukprot:TRINITY_DN5001_c0_g1_i8.p1 TRINITY_DN5001_c0_g1~~TRINITY_DN5001_c0_g1_i8.p1  ORF type:complete len:317 (+),score=52.72 TRINITY_DN5001_c0_g1_i8:46-996(+)
MGRRRIDGRIHQSHHAHQQSPHESSRTTNSKVSATMHGHTMAKNSYNSPSIVSAMSQLHSDVASTISSHSHSHTHTHSLIQPHTRGDLWRSPITDGPPQIHRHEIASESGFLHDSTRSNGDEPKSSHDRHKHMIPQIKSLRSQSTPPVLHAPYSTEHVTLPAVSNTHGGRSQSQTGFYPSASESGSIYSHTRDVSTEDREARTQKAEARLHRLRESHARAEHCAQQLEHENETRLNARLGALRQQSTHYNDVCDSLNQKSPPRRVFLHEAEHRELCNRRDRVFHDDGGRVSHTAFVAPPTKERKYHLRFSSLSLSV